MKTQNNKQLYDDCIKQAKEVIGHIVGDIDEMFNRDAIVRSVTLHLAQMYYSMKTNENFRKEQEEMDVRTKQMIEGLKYYPKRTEEF